MTLLEKMRERAEAALASGALEPIPTRAEIVEDGGLRFSVRIVERLRKKEAAARADRVRNRNPFLPYEEELVVADVSHTHVALLNKFNVLEDHLLVVTRAFEEQESFLTPADFDALARVMGELDALFFYNAGPAAGASQRHKHLQLVPRESFPMLLEELYATEPPFTFASTPLADLRPETLRERYLELVEAVGRGDEPSRYNLLATRELLVAVPRTRGETRGISVNGLGFAGSFFVKTEAELRTIREAGPLRLLREVSEPATLAR